MTIPLSPASDRRGPRETLLALTETYLRRGELDVDGRHSVAALAGRVRRPQAVGVSVPAPEWAPLAVALAAMLRGEAESAVRLVAETLGTAAFPEALRPALLGIGIRAALAADRPALAVRWRAGLRVRLARAALRRATGSEEGAADTSTGATAATKREDAARRLAGEAVLASLPDPVRELLGEDVYEAGYGPADGPTDGPADAAAGGTTDDASSGEGGARPAPDGGGGPMPSADATLHVVMDAYHGDVVSVPAHVEVLAVTPGGSAAAAGAWDVEGAPLMTVRVTATGRLPDPPASLAWHVRFVGRARALDARTSDGSLLELDWEDGGLVTTLHPPDWFEELGVEPEVLATRVTHVVVVPEPNGRGDAQGAGAPS